MRKKLEVVCGIYKVTNPKGQIYIGKSKNLYDRYKKYKYEGIPKLTESFEQYGFNNHIFEIIEECEFELLDERETYWIAFYDTFDTPTGLNLQSGGSKGHKMAEESKRKVSVNNARWNLGKSVPEERRKRISEGVSKSLIGHQRSLGYRYSDERKKDLDTKKKSTMHKNGTKIIQPDNNKLVLNTENGIYYDSIKEAASSTNLKYEHLTSMLNGNRCNSTPFIQVNPSEKTKRKYLNKEQRTENQKEINRLAHSKKVLVIKNKKEIIFDSVSEASKFLGHDRTYISLFLNGKKESSNFIIKYI